MNGIFRFKINTQELEHKILAVNVTEHRYNLAYVKGMKHHHRHKTTRITIVTSNEAMLFDKQHDQIKQANLSY